MSSVLIDFFLLCSEEMRHAGLAAGVLAVVLVATLLLAAYFASHGSPPLPPSPPIETAVTWQPPPPPPPPPLPLPPPPLSRAQIAAPGLVDLAATIALPVNVPRDWGRRGFHLDRITLGERHTAERPAPNVWTCGRSPRDAYYQGADVAPALARHPWSSTLVAAFQEGTWREGGGAPVIRVIELRGAGGTPSGVRNQSLFGSVEGVRLVMPASGGATSGCGRGHQPVLAWSSDGTMVVLAARIDHGAVVLFHRNMRDGPKERWYGPIHLVAPPGTVTLTAMNSGQGMVLRVADQRWTWTGAMWAGPRRVAVAPAEASPFRPWLEVGGATLIDTTTAPRHLGARVVNASRTLGPEVRHLLPSPRTGRDLAVPGSPYRLGAHGVADGSRTRLLNARTCGLDDGVDPTCRSVSVSPECVPSTQWPGSACRLTSAALDRVWLMGPGAGAGQWLDPTVVQSVVRGATVNRGGVLAVVYDAVVRDADGPFIVTRVAFFQGNGQACGRVELQRHAPMSAWPYVVEEGGSGGEAGHTAGHEYPVVTPGFNDDDAFVVLYPRIDATVGPTDALDDAGGMDTARRSIMELVRIRVVR